MPSPPVPYDPSQQPTNRMGLPICGARLRKKPGRTCHQAAGKNTTHEGAGRCWLHGGGRADDARLKHGRYSMVVRKKLGELYQEHEKDADPLNIFPEIALGRALLEDFINRYADFTDALLDWHQSYMKLPVNDEQEGAFQRVLDSYEILLRETERELTPKQEHDLWLARDMLGRLVLAQKNKPRQLLDISQAHQQLDTITKMVERVERVRAANAISRADLLRVMTEMGRTVETYVKDDVTKERIKQQWLSIHV